jgi:hypothetical protein
VTDSPGSQSNNTNPLTAQRPRAFRDLRTTLKKTFSTSSKEVALLVTPVDEFAKSYQYIISAYNRNEATKFISLETSLMIVRFYLQMQMRPEALQFINDAIYITSLQIEEISKIRRYLEIGKFYDECNMSRLATFYKWISANRVFVLKEKAKHLSIGDPGFRCLIRRLTLQFASIFNDMKIYEQKSPSVLMQFNRFDSFNLGFPIAKKYLVSQIVELLHLSKNKDEMIKYIRYLFHEMRDHLTMTDFNYCLKIFLAEEKSSGDGQAEPIQNTIVKDHDYFQTKFYKIPTLK